MAVGAKNPKALKVQDEIKSVSPIRASASNAIFVPKSSELHGKKNKTVELNKINQNGRFQKGCDVYQVPNASIANRMAVERNSVSRKGVELPAPSGSKAPKKLAKMHKTADAHGPAGVLVLSGSSAAQILPQNESKPAVKTTPLTQLLSKSQAKPVESSKMLVTVNVSGSTGPLRFLVDVKDPVSRVIELALRAYAREGRLPHLGVNCKFVELYCANSDFEALDPVQCVGNLGTRHFRLHKTRNEEFEHLAGKTEHVGAMPWKFMWNMMNSIICSH
ncbi:hypothetical protein O6H91_07G057500 [Diphasiastrum complanatum]|uniref:Uncharacterized protein n=2 Tax=Diphasiastrum complanatum TaxID=34168 RepID=A0ACC2D5E5_DIPCM|nr:hypothetical protein O6H91_07G057500 [Diphasiastrum complanatum]KAJ7549524.1 hypothetical protein O6H91_07G057500 [Diphasiastrum complanatum]